MSRAIKSATVTYGQNSWELESVPVGIPKEVETYDITALGDAVKKKIASTCVEHGDFEIEILKVGAIEPVTTATALSISLTPEDSNTAIVLDFGKCFLTKVDPGSASTGDKKATQKLTFTPSGEPSSGGNGGSVT